MSGFTSFITSPTVLRGAALGLGIGAAGTGIAMAKADVNAVTEDSYGRDTIAAGYRTARNEDIATAVAAGTTALLLGAASLVSPGMARTALAGVGAMAGVSAIGLAIHDQLTSPVADAVQEWNSEQAEVAATPFSIPVEELASQFYADAAAAAGDPDATSISAGDELEPGDGAAMHRYLVDAAGGDAATVEDVAELIGEHDTAGPDGKGSPDDLLQESEALAAAAMLYDGMADFTRPEDAATSTVHWTTGSDELAPRDAFDTSGMADYLAESTDALVAAVAERLEIDESDVTRAHVDEFMASFDEDGSGFIEAPEQWAAQDSIWEHVPALESTSPGDEAPTGPAAPVDPDETMSA